VATARRRRRQSRQWGTGARPAARCASSINSTDKREKRATTRYVILAGCTARRAKCDVIARPLRVPRSDKLRTYVHTPPSLFLFVHFSLTSVAAHRVDATLFHIYLLFELTSRYLAVGPSRNRTKRREARNIGPLPCEQKSPNNVYVIKYYHKYNFLA